MSQRVAPDRREEVAAADLGSNSFHLIVAREQSGSVQVLDRLRETVRLAAGLDQDRALSEEAEQRALDCLSRFGQRVADIPRGRVRAVGTNTLRKVRGGRAFLREARKALGHPIEVISGREEARLVYGGVAGGLGDAPPRRLVVDIGGGSTELVIGRGIEPRQMESAALGCVSLTQRFFGDGDISEKRFRKARLAARVELEFLASRYQKAGWEVAVGASGTIRGAWRVMRAKGWCDDTFDRDALEKLVKLLTSTKRIADIDYPDLREDRRAVFPGGLAVLAGAFDTLAIEHMRTSDRALREGVLDDLVGRLLDKDVREASVTSLAERHGADAGHAADVAATAQRLLKQIEKIWSLESKPCRLMLGWAARLHEMGLAVAHNGYHKHGEYLVRHSDLPGFSQSEQRALAALVRLHRGKFTDTALADVPEEWVEPVRRLSVLLRIAVLVHRSRAPDLKPRIQAAATADRLQLTFARTWLSDHPLTAADFDLESDFLAKAGIRLEVA